MNTCKNPDKIYIQPNAHDGWFDGNKPNDNFVEYIRKDALLEWAKKNNKRINTEDGDYSLGYVSAMIDLIDKIESL